MFISIQQQNKIFCLKLPRWDCVGKDKKNDLFHPHFTEILRHTLENQLKLMRKDRLLSLSSMHLLHRIRKTREDEDQLDAGECCKKWIILVFWITKKYKKNTSQLNSNQIADVCIITIIRNIFFYMVILSFSVVLFSFLFPSLSCVVWHRRSWVELEERKERKKKTFTD